MNHDHTLGYYRRSGQVWELLTTIALPGTVQQNTATITSADGSTLYTYGIDVAGGQVVECAFAIATGPAGCQPLPFSLLPSSNYVGAALSPQGYRLVWWTTVVDGGGGSFHYIVDYGGGWNGPRSGPVAGYNDAAYVHVGFFTGAPTFLMHAQFVAGLAPAWTFSAGVGAGDLTTTDAVTWSLPLAPMAGDPILSTTDLWIDPVSDDVHLLARSEAGKAVYYHRPARGPWSAPLFALDATLRARLVPFGDHLALVAGSSLEGLLLFDVGPRARSPGQPIDWAALEPTPIPLPAGYESIVAIYPASPPYQPAGGDAIDLAVVGAAVQNEVLHVAITVGRE